MKAQTLSIILASLFAAACSYAGTLTGPITNPANGHQYYLLAPDTWTGSEAQGVSLGGHLATVRNQAENDWILGTFGPLVGNSGPNIWIGLHDPVTNDGTGSQHAANFVWASGEPVTFTHWGQGEPNNTAAWGGEYYGILEVVPFNVLAPGDWNDQNNSSSGSSDYAVVEVVPEPSALAIGLISGLALCLRRVPAGRLADACSRQKPAPIRQEKTPNTP